MLHEIRMENKQTRRSANRLFCQHFLFILGLNALMFLVLLALYVIPLLIYFQFTEPTTKIVRYGITFVTTRQVPSVLLLLPLLALPPLSLGYTFCLLTLGREQPAKFRDLFPSLREGFRSLLLTLLVFLRVMLWYFLAVFLLALLSDFLVMVGLGDATTAALDWLNRPDVIRWVIPGLLVVHTAVMLPYALATHALADNPEWTLRDCVKQSKWYMKGHKWQYLLLAWPYFLVLVCIRVGGSHLFQTVLAHTWQLGNHGLLIGGDLVLNLASGW